jgi:hypothetical protein
MPLKTFYMNTRFVVPAIASFLIFLFTYTAVSKLVDYSSFLRVLEGSPLLGTGAGALAILLPLAELGVSLLLLFPSTRLWGLFGSFVLLVLFTSYLGYMVLYTPHLPCSCGGVISALSWKGHLFFNGGLLGLTLWGLLAEARILPKTNWPIGLTPPETRN